MPSTPVGHVKEPFTGGVEGLPHLIRPPRVEGATRENQGGRFNSPTGIPFNLNTPTVGKGRETRPSFSTLGTLGPPVGGLHVSITRGRVSLSEAPNESETEAPDCNWKRRPTMKLN